MNRIIKFRGQRTDGKGWVHGDLLTNYIHHKSGATITHGGGCVLNEVNPETVGQFTGLKDKNGTEVYEGDLLRIQAKDKWEETNYKAHEVFWHDNDAANKHVGFQMNRVEFRGNLAGGYIHETFLPKYTEQMIVTGNIHEQKQEA